MQATEQDLKTKEIDLMISYGSAASEAMLDYPCHFFQMPNLSGMIAYRIESKCAVIFGDPLCPPKELRELTYAFHKFCEESNLNVIYIAVSEKFARIAQEHCHILMEVCEELIFNPQDNPIFKSSRLQHRMDKAAKHGLTFHEYILHDEKIEQNLLEIGTNWQKARKGLGFHLGHLNFFENTTGKRWFYTKDGDLITSMAMLSRLEAHKGWLLKFFFTLPNTCLLYTSDAADD